MARTGAMREFTIGRIVGDKAFCLAVQFVAHDPVNAQVSDEQIAVSGVDDGTVGMRAFLPVGVGGLVVGFCGCVCLFALRWWGGGGGGVGATDFPGTGVGL